MKNIEKRESVNKLILIGLGVLFVLALVVDVINQPSFPEINLSQAKSYKVIDQSVFDADKTKLEIVIVAPQAQSKDEFAHTALKAASDAFQEKYYFIRVRLYENKSDIASFKSLLANLSYTHGEPIDLMVRESRSLKN